MTARPAGERHPGSATAILATVFPLKGVSGQPWTTPPPPRSLASVRPFGLPLLRLGRGSAGAGIEPAPSLLPREKLSLKSSQFVGRRDEPQGRRGPTILLRKIVTPTAADAAATRSLTLATPTDA